MARKAAVSTLCTITPFLSFCLHAVELKQLFLAEISQGLVFSTLNKAKQQSSASNASAQAEARCPLSVCKDRCYLN